MVFPICSYICYILFLSLIYIFSKDPKYKMMISFDVCLFCWLIFLFVCLFVCLFVFACFDFVLFCFVFWGGCLFGYFFLLVLFLFLFFCFVVVVVLVVFVSVFLFLFLFLCLFICLFVLLLLFWDHCLDLQYFHWRLNEEFISVNSLHLQCIFFWIFRKITTMKINVIFGFIVYCLWYVTNTLLVYYS